MVWVERTWYYHGRRGPGTVMVGRTWYYHGRRGPGAVRVGRICCGQSIEKTGARTGDLGNISIQGNIAENLQ